MDTVKINFRLKDKINIFALKFVKHLWPVQETERCFIAETSHIALFCLLETAFCVKFSATISTKAFRLL